MSGTLFIADLLPSVIRLTNVSTLVFVACSDFATDSVEGQRGRPSEVTRLDLLKVVGSRPAFFARPDGVILACAAKRSMAVQIWLWLSMGMDARTGCNCGFDRIGIIALSRPPVATGSFGGGLEKTPPSPIGSAVVQRRLAC